ncbi:MAG TPA: quinate/shikimate dehydrogenase, partial [Acidimicrobiaceae bacterium]|nr:quinate/shikimate dehydrogenase [Acidimicrobiaceae bacterium]
MISGATRVAAVIGSPVRHSLSPALHNAAFGQLGLDWAYVAFHVGHGDAQRAVDAMRVLGLGGLSVTMPHKEAVAAAVDELAPAAAALRSVNTVVPTDDGRLVGHSTDGAGFVASLAAAGVTGQGRPVGVLG